MSELAPKLDLSKSAVHEHLTTLERIGYVTSEGGRYRLGLRFLGIGLDVRDRLPVYRVAKSVVDNLDQTTGEITNLRVPEHARGVYAHQANADRGLAFDRGEHRSDWQCFAAPVLANDRPIGAITVSRPTARMSGKTLEEDVAGLVVSASNAVEVAYLSEGSVR